MIHIYQTDDWLLTDSYYLEISVVHLRALKCCKVFNENNLNPVALLSDATYLRGTKRTFFK